RRVIPRPIRPVTRRPKVPGSGTLLVGGPGLVGAGVKVAVRLSMAKSPLQPEEQNELTPLNAKLTQSRLIKSTNVWVAKTSLPGGESSISIGVGLAPNP